MVNEPRFSMNATEPTLVAQLERRIAHKSPLKSRIRPCWACRVLSRYKEGSRDPKVRIVEHVMMDHNPTSWTLRSFYGWPTYGLLTTAMLECDDFRFGI